MQNLTEAQLIEQVKALKAIKPRKEWAVLLKAELLAPSQATVPFTQKPAQFMSTIVASLSSKKFAYSFAVVLFFVVGVFGFARSTMPGDLLFPVRKLAEQSQASLIGQTTVQQNVVAFKSRVGDLAQVAKSGKTQNVPSAISEISLNASQLTKDVKDNATDTATLQDISVSLKVLADVKGTDVTTDKDVEGLYEAVVSAQIADLDKTTLTKDQQEIFTDIKTLYQQHKYTEALEKILLIAQQ